MFQLRAELPDHFHEDNELTTDGFDNIALLGSLLERYGFKAVHVVKIKE